MVVFSIYRPICSQYSLLGLLAQPQVFEDPFIQFSSQKTAKEGLLDLAEGRLTDVFLHRHLELSFSFVVSMVVEDMVLVAASAWKVLFAHSAWELA